MSKSVIIFIFFLFLGSALNASSYFKLWVNGSEATSMQQGDLFAWEFDVEQTGGSVELSIYLDLNSNRFLDEGDILLEKFMQTDGETGNDGPGDSSSTADGIIYSQLGPFGFAPGDYVFVASDQSDQSEVTAPLNMSALPDPTVQVSGTVHIEGVEAPDEALANLMIGADSRGEFLGFWSGLTDENGNYVINLPAEAVGILWEIDLFFDRQSEGYTRSDYQQIMIEQGDNSGIDIFLSLPDAFVYGDLVDENDEKISVQDAGALIRNDDWDQNVFDVIDGHYHSSVAIPADQEGAWFSVEFRGDGFLPDYLVPAGDQDSARMVYVMPGDSIHKDIRVYTADTTIYVRVFVDNAPATESFLFYAHSDSFGATQSYNDEQGFAYLSVKKGTGYGVNIVTDSDDGTAIPDGYTLDGPQWVWVQPGDTVTFNLVPAQGLLKGNISFSPGDPQYFYNYNDVNITVSDTNWTNSAGDNPNADMTYQRFVTNGIYNVRFDDWNENYLAKPAWYEHVVVENDTVAGLDFELNYRHAEIKVRLKHAPSEAFWYGFYINTMDEEFPNVFQTEGWNTGDSTFTFKVCDGDWYIGAPAWHGNEDLDTVLTITNQDSSFYIVFDYQKVTSIADNKEIIPNKFYVSQNYPNPFNPQTTIEFGLSQQQKVLVEIFDITGKSVETIVNGTLNAGVHRYQWNAAGYASGMYFYRVQTAKQHVMKKLILLK